MSASWLQAPGNDLRLTFAAKQLRHRERSYVVPIESNSICLADASARFLGAYMGLSWVVVYVADVQGLMDNVWDISSAISGQHRVTTTYFNVIRTSIEPNISSL